MSVQLKFYASVILVQKLIGLAPFSYNRLTQKFFTNKCHLIYPTTIMVIYSFFYVMLVYEKVILRASLVYWMVCLRFITTISSWIVHCAHRVAMVKLFNDAFHLHGQLIKRHNENVNIVRIMVKAWIVTVVNGLFNFFAISGTILLVNTRDFDESDDSEGTSLLIRYAVTIMSFFIQYTISTIFFGMTLMAKLYFLKLNASKLNYLPNLNKKQS